MEHTLTSGALDALDGQKLFMSSLTTYLGSKWENGKVPNLWGFLFFCRDLADVAFVLSCMIAILRCKQHVTQ